MLDNLVHAVQAQKSSVVRLMIQSYSPDGEPNEVRAFSVTARQWCGGLFVEQVQAVGCGFKADDLRTPGPSEAAVLVSQFINGYLPALDQYQRETAQVREQLEKTGVLAPITLSDEVQLEVALICHDWHYEWSDDHQEWLEGNRQWARIRELMRNVKPELSQTLYRKYVALYGPRELQEAVKV